MQKIEIYYGNNPHPVENREWGEIYKKIHGFKGYDKPGSVIMSRKFFTKYYHKLPFYFGTRKTFEKIFDIMNDGDQDIANPLATIEGQRWLAENKIHHTSMSVGDVIKKGKNYYIVKAIGFGKLKLV